MPTPRENPTEVPDRRKPTLETLQTAIDEGDASGTAEPGVFDRVRNRLHLAATRSLA